MKNEKKKIDTFIPASNSTELQHRFGAIGFVEHISEEDESEILSLDSLRKAFATIAEENAVETGNFFDEETERIDLEEENLTADEPDAWQKGLAEWNEEKAVDLNPRTIVEAMLFVGDRNNRALTANRIAEKMRNVTPEEIEQSVAELNQEYLRNGSPYTIIKETGGYRMVLRSEFEPVLIRFYGKIREASLSQQAIDILAVVAYRQPVTAEDVQKLRKQPSLLLLNQLVRRGLLGTEREIRDKKKIILYKTTDRFLELFQLKSLDDLPISEDIDFR